jgi:hypothetical protein
MQGVADSLLPATVSTLLTVETAATRTKKREFYELIYECNKKSSMHRLY